jgi:hypothetical protein
MSTLHPRLRRLAALALLPLVLVQACYTSVDVATPEPGDRITRLHLNSGEEVAVPAFHRVHVQDSVVQLRHNDAGAVRTMPASDVAAFTVNRFSPGGTAVAVVVVTGGLLLLALSQLQEPAKCGASLGYDC